jgi:hypothetical protein
MNAPVHLVVEEGEDAGKLLTVPPDGARLGRSSSNDIVIEDAQLSRHHCRLFFKSGDGLWIADLGSANETLVDGISVTEAPLRKNSKIVVGETVMRVLNDGRDTATAPLIDLGLGPGDEASAPRRRIGLGPLLLTGGLVVVAAVAIWTIKLIHARPRPAPVAPPAETVDLTLTVDYEKIEATAQNIFSYRLQITPDRKLAIQIDDLENKRVVRKEKAVEQRLLDNLAEALRTSGFFQLDDAYRGVAPRALDRFDLSVTIGKDTHRSVVVNRNEPDVFKIARERIEEFGKVELGLWAIQFSAEKLTEMAETAYLLGKKLYDERQIEYGNLSRAIKALTEADWYLETVSPKPDFYNDILATREVCRTELDERYVEQNYRAERAMKLGDWDAAATELRVLCELIPDRADDRHKDARKKLLEVEARLEPRR